MALSEEEISLLSCAGTASDLQDVTYCVLLSAWKKFPQRMAVISSFGAESAVLLAYIARVDGSIPVYFLDTGRHFPETLHYRDELTRFLKLQNVRTLVPSEKELIHRDPHNQLAAFDPDACCALRKVEPLEDLLPDFDIWITGRKRSQALTRAALPLVEPQGDGRVKMNPLAGWNEEKIAFFMREQKLPVHPLVAHGYRSIGCAPCTRPVKEGEDSRSGRWSGQSKTECGIHRPVPTSSKG